MQHSMARDCRGDIGFSAFVTCRENFKCIFPYLQVFPNGTENAKLLSFQICRLQRGAGVCQRGWKGMNGRAKPNLGQSCSKSRHAHTSFLGRKN